MDSFEKWWTEALCTADFKAQVIVREDMELAFNAGKLSVIHGNFGQICSYCGWESNPKGAGWEELQAHVNECVKHPIATLKREIELLKLAKEATK